MSLIVDASITIAWYAHNQANAYSDRIRRLAKGHVLHVPAVWPFEFANVLHQLRRRGRMNDHQLATILDLSRRLNVTVHAQPPVAELVAMAERYDLSAYDAAYLLLALDLRYPVASSDETLRKALRVAGATIA